MYICSKLWFLHIEFQIRWGWCKLAGLDSQHAVVANLVASTILDEMEVQMGQFRLQRLLAIGGVHQLTIA